MKKSKKIVSLLAIIFLLSTSLNIHAADYADAPTSSTAEITLTPSATEVKVGENVTITLSAKCGTGIEGVDATLKYDKTKLEFTNSEQLASTGFTSMSGVDESTGEFKLSVLYTGQGEAPTESNFATLSFKVLESATANETLSVKLSEIEVGDSDDEWMTIADKEVILKVVEEQKPGNEEENPDEGEQNPDNGEQNPDEGEQNPDEGEQNPDEGEQNPDEGEQNPEEGEQNPDEGEQNPDNGEQKPDDGEQKPSDEPKDPTTADKPMNNAGLEAYGLMGIVAIAFIAIVLYAKCKKYSDVI